MDKHEALDWFLRRKSMYLDDKCQAAEDIAIGCIMRAIDGDWISVKDRLPEESGRYLVYAKEGERETHRTIATFQKTFHLTGRMAYWKVTHWMPLPTPPEENCNDD